MGRLDDHPRHRSLYDAPSRRLLLRCSHSRLVRLPKVSGIGPALCVRNEIASQNPVVFEEDRMGSPGRPPAASGRP